MHYEGCLFAYGRYTSEEAKKNPVVFELCYILLKKDGRSQM